MKKLIAVILTAFAIASFSAQAQNKPVKQDTVKRDTIIQLSMKLNEFRALLYAVDSNIDSKKASKEIVDFLQKSARMVQPADQPKSK